MRFALLLLCASCAPLPEVCVDGVDRTPVALIPDARAGALAFAHAHNDYEHQRPLEDALAQRFHSVEVDVFHAAGAFEVSHLGFNPKGTLEELYLKPLQAKVDAQGSVLGDGAPFTLWLDLKDSSARLGEDLEAILSRYPMLSIFDGTRAQPASVTVVLTGDAGMKTAFVTERRRRHASRDSNTFSPDDPPKDAAWTHYALSWKKYLDWDGKGALPAETSERLACIANRAHALGKKVRFYGTPDTEEVWKASLDHGVDFINTDRLKELGALLGSR